MKNKQATSFRLSDEGKALLLRLAEHLGISQASVLEMLIRQSAGKEFGPVRKEGRGG